MDISNDSKGANALSGAFQGVAKSTPTAVKRKAPPPPFSLRLTAEERSRLEQDAGSVALGAYIRSRLFDGTAPARHNNRRPAREDRMLAQLLGGLGQSRIANNLNQLAHAANSGSLLLTPEGEASLRAACDAVRAMRRTLMQALGLERGLEPGQAGGAKRGERP